MTLGRYVILQVDGHRITPAAAVGPALPGAMFTVCDVENACCEVAHFEAHGSKTEYIRDRNLEGARHSARNFVASARNRDARG